MNQDKIVERLTMSVTFRRPVAVEQVTKWPLFEGSKPFVARIGWKLWKFIVIFVTRIRPAAVVQLVEHATNGPNGKGLNPAIAGTERNSTQVD
jgi:hypothetical protein